jgi:hypothetical protein
MNQWNVLGQNLYVLSADIPLFTLGDPVFFVVIWHSPIWIILMLTDFFDFFDFSDFQECLGFYDNKSHKWATSTASKGKERLEMGCSSS